MFVPYAALTALADGVAYIFCDCFLYSGGGTLPLGFLFGS
jgi:hypothetical protein